MFTRIAHSSFRNRQLQCRIFLHGRLKPLVSWTCPGNNGAWAEHAACSSGPAAANNSADNSLSLRSKLVVCIGFTKQSTYKKSFKWPYNNLGGRRARTSGRYVSISHTKTFYKKAQLYEACEWLLWVLVAWQVKAALEELIY